MHPEILDTFEAGWNALGTDMQRKWQSFGRKYNFVWKSWAHVALKLLEDGIRQKKERPYYKDLLESATVEVSTLILRNLSHSGSLFGLPDITRTRDIRVEITGVVAELITRKEIGNFIQRLKEDIERDGLDALRKYLSEYN